MPDTVTTLVDLMRHGEPVGGRKYRGQIDDPLSDTGWAQMRDAVPRPCPWNAVVSSSLRRCSEFAQELSEQQGLPLALDARLMELGFGSWEGKTADELKSNDPGILMRFWSDPTRYRPDGAETLRDFRDRIDAAWRDILARHRGGHVLVVGHAGMIRMLLTLVLDMPMDRLFRWQVPGAHFTRFQIEESDGIALPRLLFHAGRL